MRVIEFTVKDCLKDERKRSKKTIAILFHLDYICMQVACQKLRGGQER